MNKLLLVAGGALVAAALALAVDRNNVSESLEEATRLAGEAAGGAPQRQLPESRAQVQLSYAPIVKRTAPAVVNIYTARVERQRGGILDDPFYRYFFGQGRSQPQPRVEQSLGSGVIVAADGLVVTNNHVVEGADEILVALPDRREFPAKLIFADPRTDLAVLRIDPKGQALPSLRLGDSDRAQVGDIVLAIGNPFGVGQTVTEGIVSAVARTGIGVSDYQFFLQTDAAINPGNSGGALVAMNGDLIGINTAIFSRSGGSNGIGFAIPSNMVRMFLNAARTGKLVTAWMGAEGEPVTPEIARRLGLDRPAGVLVTSVTSGSPAAAAGIRRGDVIFAVDGKDVADPGMLRYRIATQGVGEQVTVTLIRDGAARNLVLKLEAPPENPPRDLTRIGGANLLSGVVVGNLSPAFAQEIGAGLPENGVVVVRIAPQAPAAQLNFLQPGDLIEAVNGRPVATVDELGRMLRDVEGSRLSIRLSRSGQRAECTYDPPSQFYCRT